MPICFSGVGFKYSRGLSWEKTALKNINMVVEKNEILGVIGPTGSGKTTLLQLMNGVLYPSEGLLMVDEQNTAQLRGRDITRLRQKVGLVFQFPEDQLFESSVYEDVAFGPRNLGLGGTALRDRVRWALETMNLDFEVIRERRPQTLSGGQKRRAAIAGILALKPEYLILDEPGAGLDPEGRRLLMSVIVKLREEQGIGVVIVSHRLQDILRICDRIAVLADGELFMVGTPREILEAHEQLGELGLQLPAVNQVVYRLKPTFPSLPAGLVGEEAIAEEIDQALRNQR